MESIGRYRVERELGRGAFATVLLARDERRRPVAVKVLSPEAAADADLRQRFLTEARLLQSIQEGPDAPTAPRTATGGIAGGAPESPGADDHRAESRVTLAGAPATRAPEPTAIVRVHEVGELDDGRPWFAMDHCDAGSLADLRHRPNDPGMVLRLCADAGRALAQLHDHHVVHRDVTPGNLLLRTVPGGVQVVLSDLGVARHLSDAPDALTVGTPAYMAREQALGGVLDARSDIYSLAAVTYTLLVGHTPFAVRSVEELVARTPGVPAASIAERVGAPPLLDDLLQAALSSDPQLRPPDARVFAAALDRIADAMGVAPIVTLAALGGAPAGTLGASPAWVGATDTWQGNSPHQTAALGPPPPDPTAAPTPTTMLRSYLGDDSYQVQQARERHTRLLRAWMATTVAALVLLAVLVLAWPHH